MILSAPQCRSFIIRQRGFPLSAASPFPPLIYFVPYSAPFPLYRDIYIYREIYREREPTHVLCKPMPNACPVLCFMSLAISFFTSPPPLPTQCVFVFFIILIYNLLWRSFEIRLVLGQGSWSGVARIRAQQDAATMWHTIPRRAENRSQCFKDAARTRARVASFKYHALEQSSRNHNTSIGLSWVWFMSRN